MDVILVARSAGSTWGSRNRNVPLGVRMSIKRPGFDVGEGPVAGTAVPPVEGNRLAYRFDGAEGATVASSIRPAAMKAAGVRDRPTTRGSARRTRARRRGPTPRTTAALAARLPGVRPARSRRRRRRGHTPPPGGSRPSPRAGGPGARRAPASAPAVMRSPMGPVPWARGSRHRLSTRLPRPGAQPSAPRGYRRADRWPWPPATGDRAGADPGLSSFAWRRGVVGTRSGSHRRRPPCRRGHVRRRPARGRPPVTASRG